MRSKDIFVPLTICMDETRRALVIVLPCYGVLEIVGIIIIIIIIIIIVLVFDHMRLQCLQVLWIFCHFCALFCLRLFV